MERYQARQGVTTATVRACTSSFLLGITGVVSIDDHEAHRTARDWWMDAHEKVDVTVHLDNGRAVTVGCRTESVSAKPDMLLRVRPSELRNADGRTPTRGFKYLLHGVFRNDQALQLTLVDMLALTALAEKRGSWQRTSWASGGNAVEFDLEDVCLDGHWIVKARMDGEAQVHHRASICPACNCVSAPSGGLLSLTATGPRPRTR